MEFGEKIKSLRLKQGLTLEQVGERVGVGKSTVRKWESGQIANMRRDKIALLAKALGVTPQFLMGWDEAAAPIKEAFGPNTPAAQKLRELGEQLAVPSLADPSERELVGIYRDLNALGQQTLMGTARGLSANPDMKKAGTSTGATA